MCGRYALARDKRELLEEFAVELDGTADEELRPDYNIAPTKPVYAVLNRAPKTSPESGPVRQLRVVRWGLVPGWAKDPSIGARMINARVETVAEKPSFRKAFAERRCLLPADGYFEWAVTEDTQASGGGKGKPKKQPYFIHPADGGIMAMAGLYEFWRDRGRADDDPLAWLATCAVITTSAEDEMGAIHDRMPMLIERDRWAEWLDPGAPDAREFLIPAGATGLKAYPISTAVNSVRNNGPELLEPLSEEKDDSQALF